MQNTTPERDNMMDDDNALSERRLSMIVYPSLLAFLILAGYGFFLIYSLTKDVHSLAIDVGSMSRHVEENMTLIAGTMMAMNDNMTVIADAVDDMESNIWAMNASIQDMDRSMTEMNGLIASMNNSINTMNGSMSHMNILMEDLARNTSYMQLDMMGLNRNISTPMSLISTPIEAMRSVMPFGGNNGVYQRPAVPMRTIPAMPVTNGAE